MQEKVTLTLFIFLLAIIGCMLPFFITKHFSTIADRIIAILTSLAGSTCFSIGLFLMQESLEELSNVFDQNKAKFLVISCIIATYFLLFGIDLIGKYYGKDHDFILKDNCGNIGANEISKPLLKSEVENSGTEHSHHHTCQTVEPGAQMCLTKSLGIQPSQAPGTQTFYEFCEILDSLQDACGIRDCEAYCCESDEEQHIVVCVKNPESCPHPNGLHPPEITQASKLLSRVFKLPLWAPLTRHSCTAKSVSEAQTAVEQVNNNQKIDSKKITDFLLTAVFFLCFSVHSVIEGIGLGSTKHVTTFGLGIALHKGLAGFAIGASLIHAKLPIFRFLTAVLTFSLMTPLGVLIGTLATTYNDDAYLAHVFTSISSGTFLYISVNGMLANAFVRQQDYLLKSGAGLFGAVIVIISEDCC